MASQAYSTRGEFYGCRSKVLLLLGGRMTAYSKVSLYKSPQGTCEVLTDSACSCHLARHLYLRRRPQLRLVPQLDCKPAFYIILPPQRCIVAQDSAVLATLGLSILHHIVALRSTILDSGGMVEFCLLQSTQKRLHRQSSHATLGSSSS